MNRKPQKRPSAQNRYDYANNGWPRDFDIRIEVAEQKEILQQTPPRTAPDRWQSSEYDF